MISFKNIFRNAFRNTYKEKYKDLLNDYASIKIEYDDCCKFIAESKKFIINNKLNEEFNKIMNDKYGIKLYGTICKIKPAGE